MVDKKKIGIYFQQHGSYDAYGSTQFSLHLICLHTSISLHTIVTLLLS